MNEELVNAIINEFKAGGYDVPENITEPAAQAEWIIEAAESAMVDGVRNDTVRRIVSMVESAGEGETTKEEVPRQEAASQEPPEAPKKQRAFPFPGFPAPEAVEDTDVPIMPRDLSSLNDTSLRKLHSEWNAVLVYAIYAVGVKAGEVVAAKQAYELYLKRAINSIPKTDGVTGKAKFAGQIDAEAHEVENVARWKAKLDEGQHDLDIMKALRDGYQANLDRISREWTMRQGQWEKENRR